MTRDESKRRACRQLRQILRRDIDLHRRLRLAGVRPVFVDARGVRGAQAAFGGGIEIARMRGHHHALRGRQIERLAGGEIDARLRLVVAGDFGAENGVPRKLVAAREIDHQRDVAVRHRRQHEFGFQPRQRRRHVRPGIEPVPDARQIVEHFVGQVLQAEARQQPHEVAPVQHVELGERDAPRAHLLHAGLVFAAPGVGEGFPVEAVAEGGQDAFGLARDRCSPVDDGAEHVEKQCSDTDDRGFYDH